MSNTLGLIPRSVRGSLFNGPSKDASSSSCANAGNVANKKIKADVMYNKNRILLTICLPSRGTGVLMISYHATCMAI